PYYHNPSPRSRHKHSIEQRICARKEPIQCLVLCQVGASRSGRFTVPHRHELKTAASRTPPRATTRAYTGRFFGMGRFSMGGGACTTLGKGEAVGCAALAPHHPRAVQAPPPTASPLPPLLVTSLFLNNLPV